MRSEPEKLFCILPVFVGCGCASVLGSSSQRSSVVEMNAQTARALRLGRRILIRHHGETTRHERMLLVIVSDQEWFVVEPGGRIRLKDMDAAEEARLIPVSGERLAGVISPMESFLINPLREKRGRRGSRRVRCMLRSSSSAGQTCLSQQYCLRLEMEVGCASSRAPTAKLVTSCLQRTLSRRRRCSTTTLWVLWREDETVHLAWHPRYELQEQQALSRVLQLVRDDPTLQERVKQPAGNMTPPSISWPRGNSRRPLLGGHNAPRAARTVLGRGGGPLSGDPSGKLAHRGPTIGALGGPITH